MPQRSLLQCEAENDRLRDMLGQVGGALVDLFSSVVNDMHDRGLPREWTPNSELGRAWDAIQRLAREPR